MTAHRNRAASTAGMTMNAATAGEERGSLIRL
jgi:hypothetical protein